MRNQKKLLLPVTLGVLGLFIGGGGAALANWADAAGSGETTIQSGDLKVQITGLPTITHDCDGKTEPIKGGSAFVEPGEAYKISYPVKVSAEGKNIAVKTSGTGNITDKSGKKLDVVHGATEGFLVKDVKAEGAKDATLGGLLAKQAPPAKVLEEARISGKQVRDNG